MALQNQFVTSFSELYIREGAFTDANGDVIGSATGTKPSAALVRDWFTTAGTGSVSKRESYTFTGTNAGAAGVVTINILDGNGETLDTEVISVTATEAASAVAAKVRSELANSTYVVSVGGTTVTTEIEFSASAGNATITLTLGTGVTILAVAATAPAPAFNRAFVAGSGATQLIPLVMEVGTLSNEATIIDVPTFGEEFRGKLRGQLDGGQLDVQLYWAPREAVHLLIRQFAQRGTAVSVGIRWRPTSDAALADTELVVFDSFVSSFGIDTTFDDVAKVSATMVVDGAEHFASGDTSLNDL